MGSVKAPLDLRGTTSPPTYFPGTYFYCTYQPFALLNYEFRDYLVLTGIDLHDVLVLNVKRLVYELLENIVGRQLALQ